MDCKQICEELVFRYTDNEMGQELIVEYRQHIECCPRCAQEAELTHRFLMVVRRPALRCTAPEDLRQRIVAGLRRA